MSRAENDATLEMEAEAGKTYFLRQKVKMGMIKARTKLEIMGDIDGKKALNKCKLAATTVHIAEI